MPSAVNYCQKELHLRYLRRRRSTSDYSISQSDYLVLAAIQYCLPFWTKYLGQNREIQ